MIPELLRTGLDASIRISIIAVLTAGILAMARVRVSSVRHAVWTAVLAAMVMMPVLPSALPSIAMPLPAPTSLAPVAVTDLDVPPAPLDVRKVPGPSLVPTQAMTHREMTAAPIVASTPASSPRWPFVLFGIYVMGACLLFARLWSGWRASASIVRSSIAVEARTRLPTCAVEVRESSLVATPLTIGVFRSRVMLPLEWRLWSAPKLAAVLAHEGAHIDRRDPLVAFLAHVNRCVFWFHPLAWWLERTLAATAEHVCDDAGVTAMGESRGYAEVLLDIADSMRQRGGRLSWQGVGIDGRGLIAQRIERILRSDRVTPLSRVRTLAVACGCGAAILLVAACQRRSPDVSPLKPNPDVASMASSQQSSAKLDERVRQMTPEQIAALHTAWKNSPDDLDAAGTLLRYYEPDHTGRGTTSPSATGVVERRELAVWLVAHHPDDPLAMRASTDVKRDQDPQGLAELRQAWLQEIDKPGVNAASLSHAAYFFFPDVDQATAARALQKARVLDPGGGPTGPGVNVVFGGANAQDAFAVDVRRTLDASDDAELLALVASGLLVRTIPQHGWATRLAIIDARALAARATPHTADRPLPMVFGPTSAALQQLGETYLDRARTLDSQSATVRQVVVQVSERQRRTRLMAIDGVRSKGAPADPVVVEKGVAMLSEADRFSLLPYLADYANMIGDDMSQRDKARAQAWWALMRKFAEEALALAPKFTSDPSYSRAVYSANIALGLLALRDGDRAKTVGFLQHAATVPASDELTYGSEPQCESVFLDYLLKYGERESVASFLERTAELRGASKTQRLKDAADIRAGVMPVSYQNFFFGGRFAGR